MPPPSAPLLYSNFTGNIRPHCGIGQLTFYWYTPSNDGGSPITNYVLIGDGLSIHDSNTFQATVSVSNMVDYTYTIAASNADGLGPAATYRTVQAGYPTQAPKRYRTSVPSPNTMVVNYLAPFQIDGANAAVKWYVLTSKSSDVGDPIMRSNTNGSGRSITFNGINSNSLYQFLVKAVSDPGYSPGLTYTSTVGVMKQSSIVIDLDSSKYVSGSSNWSDSSPNAKNATLFAGTGQTWNNYVYLDGSSYFTASNGVYYPNWTVSAWFQPFSTITNAAILGCTDAKNFMLYSYGSNYNSAALAEGPTIINGTPFQLSDFTWNNIVATFDGTNWKTYINGELIGTEIPGTPSNIAPSEFLIGGGATNPINGLIGRATVYSRALSSNEVAHNYTATGALYFNDIVQSDLLCEFQSQTFSSGNNIWYDSSVNYNTLGVYSGSPLSSNGFVYFNGSASYLSYGIPIVNTWTLSIWFKSTDGTVDNCPLVGEPNANGQRNCFIDYDTSSNVRGGFMISGSSNTYGTSVSVPVAIWTFMTVSYDGTNITTYINGSNVGTSNVGSQIMSSDTNFRLGGLEGTPLFKGFVGEFSLHNRALSNLEVFYNYNITSNIYT